MGRPMRATDESSDETSNRFGWLAMHRTPIRAAGFIVAIIAIVTAATTADWSWLAAFVDSMHSSSVTYITPVGQRQEFKLEDGSRITLNTDSRVNVHFDGRHRDVAILSGEVSFDVVHDSVRPFRACANGHLLTDLGTQFNVLLASVGTTVTVRHGDVQLTGSCSLDKDGNIKTPDKNAHSHEGVSAPEPPVLSGGDQIRLPEDGPGSPLQLRRLTRSQIDTTFAWQDGLLIFENTPLPQALEQINRYFPQRLEIVDPAIAQMKITGTYVDSRLGPILQGLQASHGIVVLPPDIDDPDPTVIRLGSAGIGQEPAHPH